MRSILAVVLVALSALAAPTDKDVTVTNTSANPVPVTGTVQVGGTVPVSGTVQVSGTPAVTVGNLPVDSGGNLKVVSPGGRFMLFNAPQATQAPGQSFTTIFEDISDCRNFTAFVITLDGYPLAAHLEISMADNGAAPVGEVAGTQLGDAPVYAFTVNGTPAVGPFAALKITNTGTQYAPLFTIEGWCTR